MSQQPRQFKKREDYPKRNTEYFKQFVRGFSGWGNLARTINRNGNTQPDGTSILIGLFCTASRASELGMLRKYMVSTKEYKDQILIQEQPVLKQKDKVMLVDEKGNPLWKDGKQEYTFESKAGYRTYLFSKKEPLSEAFMVMVNRCKNDDDIIFPYDRKSMFYHLSRIDGLPIPKGESNHWSKYKGEWWNHRVRSERVCQLIRDYDWTPTKVKKFVGWQSAAMVDVYADMYPTDLIVSKEVEYK